MKLIQKVPIAPGVGVIYHNTQGGAEPLLPATNQEYWFYGGDGTETPEAITFSGSNVTAVADSSVNARDLSKTGAGNITYEQSVTDVNRGALVFPGNAYLVRTIAEAILANLSTFSMYIVLSTVAAGVSMTGVSESRSGNDTPFLRHVPRTITNGHAGFQHRSDASVLATAFTGDASLGDGSPHVITLRRHAGGYQVRVDGGTVVAADAVNNPGTTTITRLTIGALLRVSASEFFTGKVFLAAGYSSDNYADIEPLLGEHYGVSMPPFSQTITYNSSIDAI